MLALAQVQTTPVQQIFLQSYETAHPLRLALTPILDGVVSDQEWELLNDTINGPTFFQWEPDQYYWAAKPKHGTDVVLSLDANADGWLVGNDNLEIRASLQNGQVRVTVRQLDATDRNGPVWSQPEIFQEALKIASKNSADYWNFEGSFNPILFGHTPELDTRLGVRVDCVPAGSDLGPSYLPRKLAYVRLRYDMSESLYSGFSWKPEIRNRIIARYDPFKFRFNFVSTPEAPTIRTIDVFGEGFARTSLETITLPFPQPDDKGRSLVDFESEIDPDVVGGYRIIRAILTDVSGQTSTIRTSVKISELIEFDVFLPRNLRLSSEDQEVKGHVTIRSRANGRVQGSFDYWLPTLWTPMKGKDSDFLIYHSRGNQKIPVQFTIPAGTSGVFPITCSAKIGDRTIAKTTYIPVQ